jgi:hypothetical protein
MRKVVLVAVTAGLLVAGLGVGSAQAAPAAPRAKAVASPQAANPLRMCINLDKDFRSLCFFGKQPFNQECEPTMFSLPPIATLYRCEPRSSVVPGDGCINIENDGNTACLLGAEPPAGCRASAFSIPGVATYYRCADRRMSPVERVRRIIR